MNLVADASVVVAALADDGTDGRWAADLLAIRDIGAPHHMPCEVTNVLRRSVARGTISAAEAAIAHADLMSMPVELLPFGPVASRVWQLGDSVTSYDAWYVALAEALDVPLATLDQRLARASGPRCRFLLPPGD
ncbi:MAG: type II toxin-antitoxin system VapC family toxin [Actinomycetota bacterium]|nr:type II toxin-antitoxin system VapC family toxin [Actinomycetota bacterium]